MVTAAVPFAQPSATAPGENAPAHAPADLDDGALIAAITRGETAALDELYRRYRSVAFALAYALLQSPHAAEDAVQDAFLKAWRSARSYRSARGSVRAWLLTIVRNVAIDQLRARQVARRHQLDLGSGDSDAHPDVFTAVSAAGDADRVRIALAALPPEQRLAIELAFIAGLTHGEIAQRTGLPLGTVKGRVRLGLRRLRHDLRDLSPAFAGSDQPDARAA